MCNPQGSCKAGKKTAREYAFAILSRADCTEQGLRQKLAQKGCPQAEIDDTVANFKEQHLLDDADYAECYVRASASARSVCRIKNDLMKKGISRDLIEAALAEEAVDEETQIRRFLLKKGFGPDSVRDPALVRRLTAALARRGYPYDSIRRVEEELAQEPEI